jgi:hypothetical protein
VVKGFEYGVVYTDQIYGFPYVVVDSTLPLRAVRFQYASESDGVNHTTGQSFPFYPIPDEAISQAHWIEGGDPGNVDLRASSDRHLLIVDRDRRHLYELYNVFFDGSHDTRCNNSQLNPAFGALKASDFEVIQLGYRPPAGSPPSPPTGLRILTR